ncbi:MAG: recombination regulator RecX [Bacillota bacterium]|nr:recombination regulator RecX [Bacillota bacterium]
MAIITKITTQQKRQDRYNVFLDYGKGEQYAFSVDENVLIKFQLKKGLELDDFALMEINYQDDIRKSYNLAVGYLAARMRTEKEIRDYLAQKDMEEPVIKEVIHKLFEQNYINEQEFAFAYVRTQMNTTDKGVKIIKTELKEKGLAEGLIQSALELYPFEMQVEKALKLCSKYSKKNTNESKRLLNQKLESMLMRKGYPYEVINLAVNEAEQAEGEKNDEWDALVFQAEKAHRKYSKYSGYEYRQKMKQALFSKGFSIELIERVLSNKNEDE